jgi:hypothetical protein
LEPSCHFMEVQKAAFELLSHGSASARSQTTVVNGRRKEIVSALSTLWGKVASSTKLPIRAVGQIVTC